MVSAIEMINTPYYSIYRIDKFEQIKIGGVNITLIHKFFLKKLEPLQPNGPSRLVHEDQW